MAGEHENMMNKLVYLMVELQGTKDAERGVLAKEYYAPMASYNGP